MERREEYTLVPETTLSFFPFSSGQWDPADDADSVWETPRITQSAHPMAMLLVERPSEKPTPSNVAWRMTAGSKTAESTTGGPGGTPKVDSVGTPYLARLISNEVSK